MCSGLVRCLQAPHLHQVARRGKTNNEEEEGELAGGALDEGAFGFFFISQAHPEPAHTQQSGLGAIVVGSTRGRFNILPLVDFPFASAAQANPTQLPV